MQFQIDEFINQLMTSEKFSEMADFIAEKAARKIQTVGKSNATLRQSYHSDRKKITKNKKPIKEKQKYAQEDSKLGKRNKHKQKSGKYGQINTEAFLKHDGSFHSLNYKHMTKELARNKEKIRNSPNNHKENPEHDSDERFTDHSREESQHRGKEKSVNTKSKGSKDINMNSQIEKNSKEHFVSSNDKHSDTSNEDSIGNKTFTKKKKIETNSNQELSEDDRTQEFTKEDNINADTKQKKSPISQTVKKNIDDNLSDSSNFEGTDHANLTDQLTTVNYSSKEVVEVAINRAVSDTGSIERHSAETLEFFVESNEKHSLKRPTERPVKQVIRRENGKLYTFLESPDYNEYHADVAKQKSMNNYVNTFK